MIIIFKWTSKKWFPLMISLTKVGEHIGSILHDLLKDHIDFRSNLGPVLMYSAFLVYICFLYFVKFNPVDEGFLINE